MTIQKRQPHVAASFAYIFSKGESETVFTTCIYHNIEYGYKISHYIDNNFYNLITYFLYYIFPWDSSL